MLHPFFIWNDKVLIKIQPETVKAILSESNYIKIFIDNNHFFMVRATLATALKSLPSHLFKRVHKRLVVSINFVNNVAKDHLMIDGEENPLPISRHYYQSFVDSLNIIGREGGTKPENVNFNKPLSDF